MRASLSTMPPARTTGTGPRTATATATHHKHIAHICASCLGSKTKLGVPLTGVCGTNEISGGSTPTSDRGFSKTINQNSQFSAKTIISENFGNDHRSFLHRSVPTVSAPYLRPESKTVQIVATSAEHTVNFDRLTDRRRSFLTGGGQTGRKKNLQK